LPPGATVTVGRSDLADLTLPNDTKLSTQHFSVQWQGSVAMVCDLSSVNGVMVDGERATTAEARHGSWLRAGDTDFSIHIVAHTPAPADAAVEDLENLFGLPPSGEDDPAAFAAAAADPLEHMPFEQRMAALQEEQRDSRRPQRRAAPRARSCAERDAAGRRAVTLCGIAGR
jgi:predicted component of type VI protein secretion system